MMKYFDCARRCDSLKFYFGPTSSYHVNDLFNESISDSNCKTDEDIARTITKIPCKIVEDVVFLNNLPEYDHLEFISSENAVKNNEIDFPGSIENFDWSSEHPGRQSQDLMEPQKCYSCLNDDPTPLKDSVYCSPAEIVDRASEELISRSDSDVVGLDGFLECAHRQPERPKEQLLLENSHDRGLNYECENVTYGANECVKNAESVGSTILSSDTFSRAALNSNMDSFHVPVNTQTSPIGRFFLRVNLENDLLLLRKDRSRYKSVRMVQSASMKCKSSSSRETVRNNSIASIHRRSGGAWHSLDGTLFSENETVCESWFESHDRSVSRKRLRTECEVPSDNSLDSRHRLKSTALTQQLVPEDSALFLHCESLCKRCCSPDCVEAFVHAYKRLRSI